MLKNTPESAHLDVLSAPRRTSDQIEDCCFTRRSLVKCLVTGGGL